MNTFRTVLVVIDHEVIHPVVRRMFPPTVNMVRYGDHEALRGHRFNLVLRTSAPRFDALNNPFEIYVDACSPKARTFIADADSLASILKLLIQNAPWMIDGGKPVE